MSLPADADHGTTYSLEHGDLTLRYHGEPAVVRSAEYWASKKSADERFAEANTGWDQWVAAHSGNRPPATQR
jgi:hypothetical protein